MSRFFGTIRQVGYVVRDIEQAMARWADLGVGPWFYKARVPSTEYRYFGADSPLPELSIALANSGDVQIELIQQRNDVPTLYRDTLAQQGESAQHVAYWTLEHYDAWCRQMLELGWTEGHSGRMGATRGRYAYFVRRDMPSAMVEISEGTGGKAEYFETIRAAAVGWDGRDPIRRMD